MKRSNDDVVGRRRPAAAARDVAGARLSPVEAEVASYRHALQSAYEDPVERVVRDAALMADFSDFLSAGLPDRRLADASLADRSARQDGFAGSLAPDPAFRDRLRRRLWRTWVQTRLSDRRESH